MIKSAAQFGIVHMAAIKGEPAYSSRTARTDVIRRCINAGWISPSDRHITVTGYLAWSASLPRYTDSDATRENYLNRAMEALELNAYQEDNSRHELARNLERRGDDPQLAWK